VFRPNPRFINDLKKEPGVKADLAAAAKTVAGIARGITPHAPGSITTDTGGDTVTVGSDDPFFHLVEWGSVNNPPYAPIRRAVRAAGLRLEETGP
jgi:hypothetical protein